MTMLTGLDRTAWLDMRATGIGASESAALFTGTDGQPLHPYLSPYKLYCLKRGLIPEETEIPEYVQMGIELQPVVISLYHKRTGRQVRVDDPHAVVRSDAHPFMVYSPDATIIGAEGFTGPGCLEAKSVAWFKDEEWADEAIPLHYQVQLAHQCVVSGNSWGSAAAIIGGNKFVWRDFHVSESFASALIEKCGEFWQRVQDENPPPVDSHPATTLALKKLHPNDNGETVALGVEACGWDEIILNADRAIASWTEKRDEARNYLRAAIGAATYGTLPDGVTFSLKTSTVKGFEVKPRTQRVLRRKDAK